MLSNFLHNQLDFIHFVCSLSFLLLAAGCSILRKKELQFPAWTCLGLFALAQSINDLSELISLSFADTPAFHAFRIVVTIASFLFLLEFSRISANRLSARKRSCWTSAALLGTTCLGYVYGWPGVDFAAHYTLGLAAAILAPIVLFRAAHRATSDLRPPLLFLGALIGLFTLADILVDPLPSISAAFQIGDESLLASVALHGQLIRSVIASGIAISILVYTCRLSAGETAVNCSPSRKLYATGFAAFFVSVVAVGWFAAETAGKFSEQDMSSMLLTRSGIAAAAMDGRMLAGLTGSSLDIDKAEFKQLRRQLKNIRAVNRDMRFVYLMGLRNGKVVFLADAEPVVSEDYSPPGQEYAEASPLLISGFSSGKPFLEGPFTDSWGTWVSGLYPVFNPENQKTVALLGMDIDARHWRKNIAMNRIGPLFTALFVCMLTIGFLVIQQRSRIYNEKILSSERRFRGIFASAPEGVFVCDPDSHQIVDANPYLIQWLGYSLQELLDLSLADLLENYDRTAFDVTDNRGNCAFQLLQLRCRKKDGTVSDVELTGSSLSYDGKAYILAFVRDVTDQLNTREQLHHMQRMEAIGQLAGGIAHDFNNILTAIIGYASLLEMRLPEDNNLRRTAKSIIQATERGAQLTRGLLAYSRKQTISRRPVNLNSLIAELGNFLERLISEEIEIKTVLTKEPLAISADAVQLEQVLMNLATNARDAMSDGGRIIIETKRLSPEHLNPGLSDNPTKCSYALITFKDSGAGIDESVIKKIFDPFFTTKEVGKGVGLGLSIVYGIIKQHGGHIEVRSESGKGTTFHIYLPILALESSPPVPKSTSPSLKGNATILVAEDDPVVRKLTCEMLEEFGYTTLPASDGEDAVKQFRKHMNAVNLVLLDVIMPKKNGKEAYDEITRLRPGVKSLFMSGYTANIIKDKGMFEKDGNFIAKPVLPDELLTAVRQALALNEG